MRDHSSLTMKMAHVPNLNPRMSNVARVQIACVNHDQCVTRTKTLSLSLSLSLILFRSRSRSRSRFLEHTPPPTPSIFLTLSPPSPQPSSLLLLHTLSLLPTLSCARALSLHSKTKKKMRKRWLIRFSGCRSLFYVYSMYL